MHELDKIFWTQSRRQQFREEIPKSLEATGYKKNDIEDFVRRRASTLRSEISDSTVSRFLANKVATKPEALTAMLVAMCAEFESHPSLPSKDKQALSGIYRLHSEYLDFNAARPTNATGRNTPSAIDLEPGIAELADKFLAYLHLSTESSQDCEEIFFSERDPSQVHFDTFRFSGTPGIVQKSFSVVHRATEDSPIVRFANFVEHEGAVRRSSGIVLSFRNELIFWGQADRGGSSESYLFSSSALARQERYFGLMTANDPRFGPLAARFIMKRTNVTHHSKADTGAKTTEAMSAELTKDDFSLLRNRVPFEVEEEIFDGAGRQIQSKEIPGALKNILSEAFHKSEGKAGLFRKDKSIFNPTDEDEFSFNSALTLRDR